MFEYPESVLEEIRNALISDPHFDFKRSGNNLRHGICPNCGERECFVNLDQPWRVNCGRLNNCKWSETTRELYPQIFENLSRRHPATEDNPNATADAYLNQIRGFELSKIRGMYMQGNAKHKTKEEYYPSVKVIISQTCYWLRIINADDVRRFGAKSKIVGNFAGFGWVPPGMEFNEGDEIWITEGIFKSMAFAHIGIKSISGLSASNLPIDIIKTHAGKHIKWVLAEDNDDAGRNASDKFRKQIEALGEAVSIALPEIGEDWDDAFRDGRLNKEYLQDSFWRGFYHLAESYQRKSFFHYCRYKYMHSVIDFKKSLYRYEIDQKKRQEACKGELKYPNSNGEYNLPAKEINSFFTLFNSFSTITEISTCLPVFRYIEEDDLCQDSMYNFLISHQNGNPDKEVVLSGEDLISHTTLSNAISRFSRGARFECSKADFRILHDRWLKHGATFVRTINYLGYEVESKMYMFCDYAVWNGTVIKTNKLNFFSNGRAKVKTTLTSVNVKYYEGCNLDWIIPYKQCAGMNGLSLLAWWVGSLFAVQIRRKYGKWPFFEYSGERGAGKTFQIKFLWRCMGRVDDSGDYEGFDPSTDTAIAAYDQMAQVSNLPTVLLEGDHNPGNDTKVKTNNSKLNFESLKRAFNGGTIRSRGTKSMTLNTEASLFLSSILIAQNAPVNGTPALLSRFIHCNATKELITLENEAPAHQLEQMDMSEIAGFLPYCLKQEKNLLGLFAQHLDAIKREFSDSCRNVEIRLRETHAMVAAWGYVLTKLFPKLTCEDADKLKQHLMERMLDRHNRLNADHPLVVQFWEQYEYLNFRYETTGGTTLPIEILNHKRGSGSIAINFSDFQCKANSHGLDRLPIEQLKTLLKDNTSNPFIKTGSIRSAITKDIIHCWIFQDNIIRKCDE